MSTSHKPAGIAPDKEVLLSHIPGAARTIVDVGCGDGALGARLKQLDSKRIVIGIREPLEKDSAAAQHLDQVFTLDLENQEPPLEPASVDCILYGDWLGRVQDPESVLRRHRHLLVPEGTILCCFSNAQHHSRITALLESESELSRARVPAGRPRRDFTYWAIIKLFLDAGFAPSILRDVGAPCPEELYAAMGPLLHHLKLFTARTRRYLNASRYIVQGRPVLAEPSGAVSGAAGQPESNPSEQALSFVVCASNQRTLQANLLSSPDLQENRHEVLPMRGFPNAAEGLNRGLELARHPLVICVHQDVYLPRGWTDGFMRQYRLAEATLGPVGVAGVYGVRLAGSTLERIGHVVDRDRLLGGYRGLPDVVDTVDELLVAVPRGTALRFDPQLGFHFYGADLCLAARQRGLRAVALAALCFHHSRGYGLPPEFEPSAKRFAAKWSAQLPIATSCVVIEEQGKMRLAEAGVEPGRRQG
jgi:SAM-dependent methyltransferase